MWMSEAKEAQKEQRMLEKKRGVLVVSAGGGPGGARGGYDVPVLC
jgi:hypothetical protein